MDTTLDDGFQISEILPGESDGSLTTNLLDTDGNQVGTITRLSDGTTQAAVAPIATDTGGYDVSSLLKKVTGFLDNAASTAQGVANQATKLSRGIQGAATGAKAGYNLPVNWKTYAAVGGIGLVALVAIAAASSDNTARRRS
jgi:hypothetical protein